MYKLQEMNYVMWPDNQTKFKLTNQIIINKSRLKVLMYLLSLTGLFVCVTFKKHYTCNSLIHLLWVLLNSIHAERPHIHFKTNLPWSGRLTFSSTDALTCNISKALGVLMIAAFHVGRSRLTGALDRAEPSLIQPVVSLLCRVQF